MNYYITDFWWSPSIQCVTLARSVISSAATLHRYLQVFDLIYVLIDSLSIFHMSDVWIQKKKKIRREFDWKMINESVINARAIGNTVSIAQFLKQRREMKRDDIDLMVDYRHRYLWPASNSICHWDVINRRMIRSLLSLLSVSVD